MRELQTSRVVIVDDDDLEGETFRRSLARIGIPALVFARLEDLPSEPFSGVRLAALDADFANTFESASDPEEITDPTARMLGRLLASGNGPYHALIWTEHPELAESLVGRLAANRVPPAAWTVLSKASVQIDGNWDIQKILDQIAESRNGQPGLRFLSEWERAVHDAGVVTVGDLLEGDSDTESLRTLAHLERPGASREDRLRAVADSLSRLHADALERGPTGISQGIVDSLFKGDIPKPNRRRSAQLNARLLLHKCGPGALPGSVFELELISQKLGTPDLLPSFDAVAARPVPEFELRL
ncbi:MAG: hypothetical protein OXP37_01625 [Chloroflexota bacterium]|nr:hypothetical protein [Chloroflexota bacterium]